VLPVMAMCLRRHEHSMHSACRCQCGHRLMLAFEIVSGRRSTANGRRVIDSASVKGAGTSDDVRSGHITNTSYSCVADEASVAWAAEEPGGAVYSAEKSVTSLTFVTNFKIMPGFVRRGSRAVKGGRL
jgi:hypothetical protein